MGGNIQSLPRFNWTFVRRDDHHEIYQNEFGALAEKHLVPNNPKLNEEEELETYYYRFNTKKPIVKAYRADYEAGSDFCSNHKNITVFTQYIPYRLVDTRNLTHQQGLYVLSESLVGFHQLYTRLGAFRAEDTMVGFNKDGYVRVWHNPNFAMNQFEINNIILMSTANPQQFDERVTSRQEEQMVEDIWNALDKHAIFKPEFRRQIDSLRPLNFYNIKDAVDEQIRNQKYVPPKLKLQDRYGIVQSSRALLGSQHSVQNRSSVNRTSINVQSNYGTNYQTNNYRQNPNESQEYKNTYNNTNFTSNNPNNRTSYNSNGLKNEFLQSNVVPFHQRPEYSNYK